MQTRLDELKPKYPALRELEHIWLGHGITASCMAALKVHNNITVVCDENTAEVAARAIAQALNAAILVLPRDTHADDHTIARIREETASSTMLLAVGSGTINDLCKYASFLDGKPYAVYATAPSMNGYASANAAIMVQGHKQSLPAHLPCTIIADTEIISQAPTRLIRSGLGDSLCRATAQADWLLSHLLLGTPYQPEVFSWLMPHEKALLTADADMQAIIQPLMETLILSGMGMVAAGGSYPASQGEHLIAHYIEMTYPELSHQTFHGEQIGVTTLTMCRLQQHMLESTPTLSISALSQTDMQLQFGDALGERLFAEYQKKTLTAEETNQLNQRLQTEWPSIQTVLREVMHHATRLERTLKAVGAATTHAELGWSEQLYAEALRNAPFIRNRFTFLDLAYLTT